MHGPHIIACVFFAFFDRLTSYATKNIANSFAENEMTILERLADRQRENRTPSELMRNPAYSHAYTVSRQLSVHVCDRTAHRGLRPLMRAYASSVQRKRMLHIRNPSRVSGMHREIGEP